MNSLQHKAAASNNMDKYMLSITPFSSSSNVHQMYLSGVNLALNDIQNGDVAVVVFSVSQGRYHYIFGLTKQNKT